MNADQKLITSYMLLTGRINISRANIKPGINENIFKQMKKSVKTMKPHEKLCVLLFDEMSGAAHFDYNQKHDMVKGFVNNGKTRTDKLK